jgi:pilus assembly protein Flp/PilA
VPSVEYAEKSAAGTQSRRYARVRRMTDNVQAPPAPGHANGVGFAIGPRYFVGFRSGHVGLGKGGNQVNPLALVQSVRRLLRGEKATTATEYAVMLALIIVVCLSTITVMGQSLRQSVFGTVNALFG